MALAETAKHIATVVAVVVIAGMVAWCSVEKGRQADARHTFDVEHHVGVWQR